MPLYGSGNLPKKWADEYCTLVSKWEPILHCIRNRYFLDKLKEISKAEDFLLINIGAGFSMYPQTLRAGITTIEADLKDLIAFKKTRLKTQWQKDYYQYDKFIFQRVI